MNIYDTQEGIRLQMTRQRIGHWNRWGPFLAERAWGTVREDYSADGDAWNYFPHDHARSRAYRWNEDGIAGICDRHQYLCFALALWNRRDPFLKERMFGVSGKEGNHGEDVKEYYFYLDNTPTHSYMKYLYKYPQAEFPYEQLVKENERRTRLDAEYELADTGIFDENRYFDVEVEYAKREPEDLLIRINITNRGPEAAPICVLPTLWFRNTWSWGRDPRRPSIVAGADRPSQQPSTRMLLAKHYQLGEYILYCAGADELMFTENETNFPRLFGVAGPSPYVKDAFHEYVVDGKTSGREPSCNQAQRPRHDTTEQWQPVKRSRFSCVCRRSWAIIRSKRRSRISTRLFRSAAKRPTRSIDAVHGDRLSPDAKLIARQAFAGMLWSKQYYHFVVTDWLNGDPAEPLPPPQRRDARNHEWTHLFTRDIISMPDKWEFPWFASWDLAFHCAALAHVDPDFAKEQIILMLREWYMHPNGQLPAYEWDFGDVNPPVLSMAARAVFDIERAHTGTADYAFLERVFEKMLLNFTWWVNRKDALGKNIFQGGFLGMDNIGAFDRGKLPPGYMLGQADGTSWMAAFARSMLSIALLLAEQNPVYEDLASKFWEHFVYIANSMNSLTDPKKSLWHEQDGFFYDHLTTPERRNHSDPRPHDGGLRAAVWRDRGRRRFVRAASGVQPPSPVVHRASARSDRKRRADGYAGRSQYVDSGTGPHRSTAADAGVHARRERVSLAVRRARGVEISPGASARSQARWPGVSVGLRAGRVDDRPLRRQLELARADLVSG